jgi:hypothetical protein
MKKNKELRKKLYECELERSWINAYQDGKWSSVDEQMKWTLVSGVLENGCPR